MLKRLFLGTITKIKITLLPENPINSNNLITRDGSNEIIRLNVPIPIFTPLSKCIFVLLFSQFLVFKIWKQSLKR